MAWRGVTAWRRRLKGSASWRRQRSRQRHHQHRGKRQRGIGDKHHRQNIEITSYQRIKASSGANNIWRSAACINARTASRGAARGARQA